MNTKRLFSTGLFLRICFLFPLWGLGGLFAQSYPELGGGNGLSSNIAYRIVDTTHLRILADYVNSTKEHKGFS
jgi:hypothetical protein